jgi:hypothetical protein
MGVLVISGQTALIHIVSSVGPRVALSEPYTGVLDAPWTEEKPPIGLGKDLMWTYDAATFASALVRTQSVVNMIYILPKANELEREPTIVQHGSDIGRPTLSQSIDVDNHQQLPLVVPRFATHSRASVTSRVDCNVDLSESLDYHGYGFVHLLLLRDVTIEFENAE